MAKLIFKLKSVPYDEADDIKNLLAENEIAFYESPAGNWAISMHALWLNDEDQYTEAKKLIDEYQISV
jgi:nucleosome binding factor SPN SPT16 subunit